MMPRVIVLDRRDAFICELDPTQIMGLVSKEAINGEHSLTITTVQELGKTNRVLVCDGMGHWHEYVVLGITDTHEDAGKVVREYYCVWSLQYDLSATYVNDPYGCGVVPGHASVPQTATKGLQCALEGTDRWTIGTVTVTAQASASFYRRSGWEAMQTVLERWGGELQASITLSADGTVTREVDLLQHVGSDTARRRFDFGGDVTSIKRTVSDDVWPCRIIPLGASQETEEGGYTRRPDISSVNGGVVWLEDSSVVDLVKVPDGQGGWEYPVTIVTNDTYEEPADLKAWALDHISDYTRPIVSYEAELAQFVAAGMNPHGVALGDEVVVVDKTFGSDGLRISARVVAQETSLLDASDVKLTIGNAKESVAGQLASIARQVEALNASVSNSSAYRATSAYVAALLARINDEANTTGGYTYITEGQGLRTYDVAVSDPLVGAEASKVVEIKGGTIRISNSKDGQGNWEWKTLITAGVVNSELIRAIESGDGWITQMSSHGMETFEGTVSRAYFGEWARIGATDESHALIDYHSMQLIDKEGSTYFHVSDLRDASGKAYLTDVFTGDGSTTSFTLAFTAASTSTGYTVTVSDGSGGTVTKNSTSVVFSAAPTDGATITVTYATKNAGAKAYTLGSRGTGTIGARSVVAGAGCVASGAYSHAEGNNTTASGQGSHAEGRGTTASGLYSHAEGQNAAANSRASHAEGYNTAANGYYSHAEGQGTTASNMRSHAEGQNTTASGSAAHAEGTGTTASSASSHAEGNNTTASGQCSHAEGYGTTASNLYAHAEGYNTTASGLYSHAQNRGTKAASWDQTVMGKYNIEDSSDTYALIIGNGSSDSNRSNALTLKWNGTMDLGKPLPVASGGTGTAEFGSIVTEDISSAVSVPHNSWRSLDSVTLDAGDWIVSYNAQFASNATGRRVMFLHTTNATSNASNLRQGGVSSNAVSGGSTYMNACRVLHLTSRQTWYLNVFQTSGESLSTYGYIRAFRIK